MSGNKVSQFIKKRYLTGLEESAHMMESTSKSVVAPIPAAAPLIEQDQEVLDYVNSKQGRAFGWWVSIAGHRVATLDYRCLVEDMVHLYSVSVIDENFSMIELDPAKWILPNVTLQSMYAEDYIVQGLTMASMGKGMIIVEDLIIPEEHFRKQYREMEAFHKRLLG